MLFALADHFLLSDGSARVTAASDSPPEKPKLDLTRAFEVANDDPMMASVAGRYASALYDLATEMNQLKVVEQALKSLQALLDESEDMRRLVRSPVFSADEQSNALQAVMAKAGVEGLAVNFVKLITRNRRLFVLPEMISDFQKLAANGRGEMQAEITSAMPLTDAQTQLLKDTLRTSVGKDVAITPRVDPGLLGGLIVKIGSRMIDSSIRTKLNNLKIAMKEVG